MKNLLVWQKLILIGLVFIVPFAVVTYKMVASVDRLGVEFSRQEIRGLEYYQPLLVLLDHLQLHQGLAAAVHNGDVSSADKLAATATTITADLLKLDAVDSKLDPSLHLRAKWQVLQAEVHDLIRRTPTLAANESDELHRAVLGNTVFLITWVGDASNLTLDPDVDSYYLMNVLIFQLPELSNLIAEAAAMGHAATTAEGLNAQRATLLARQASVAEYLNEIVAASFVKSFDANSSLQPDLAGAAAAMEKATTEAVQLIRELGDDRQMPVNGANHYAAIASKLSAVVALRDHTREALDALIQTRVDRFLREIATTLIWALLGIILTSLIAIYMMRDIVRALRQVINTANKIAVGDLSALTDTEQRKDELGELTQALGRMVASLREMVVLAQDIAGGNLSGTITPQSSRDDMGNALVNMVGQLKGLVGEVHRSGIRVNSAVNQIAAGAKEQQATAAEIAATTTEVSVTSKEISATSKELVRTMSEVAGVADQTATLAGGGQAGLNHMEATMQRVMDAAATINAKLAVLNEKAGNINQVVTTITKVADQTNLLSLNAAIEAEKAGEYGRGFSVVATEIRRLADQTAIATYDIEQMVKEIQSAVAAGVMGMDLFSEEVRLGMHDVQQIGNQLTQIILGVQALAPRFDVVTEGMQAQASGAEQIMQALNQLSGTAQQTVETLRQSNHALDDLDQAVIGLRSGVSRFKLEA